LTSNVQVDRRRFGAALRQKEEIYQFGNFLGAVKKRIIQRILKHFDLFPIERFVRALPVTRSCVHLKGFFLLFGDFFLFFARPPKQR
jgi:hypothetical protein